MPLHGHMTREEFRLLLVRYPERELVSAEIEGTEEDPTRMVGGNYNPIGDVLNISHIRFQDITFALGPGFPGATANHTEWIGVRMPGANFQKTQLKHAQFQSSSLPDADFTSADLTFALVEKTHLRYTIFRDVMAHLSCWRSCTFGGIRPGSKPDTYTDLSHADFEHACFVDCSFTDCLLDGTSFRAASFSNCRFEPMIRGQQIDFRGATVKDRSSSFPARARCVDGVWPERRDQ